MKRVSTFSPFHVKPNGSKRNVTGWKMSFICLLLLNKKKIVAPHIYWVNAGERARECMWKNSIRIVRIHIHTQRKWWWSDNMCTQREKNEHLCVFLLAFLHCLHSMPYSQPFQWQTTKTTELYKEKHIWGERRKKLLINQTFDNNDFFTNLL